MLPDRASGYQLQHVREHSFYLESERRPADVTFMPTAVRHPADVSFATRGVKRRCDRHHFYEPTVARYPVNVGIATRGVKRRPMGETRFYTIGF